MDGMNYFSNLPSTRARYTKAGAILKTAVFLMTMVALTLVLHALGWTPPVDAALMGP